MSAQNLQPIEAVLNLVVDAINDGIHIAEKPGSALADVMVFTNLIGDLIPALPMIPLLPSSLAGFSESDASALVAFVVGKLQIPNAHAVSVLNSALAVAQSICSLVSSIRNPVLAPAA